MVGSSKELRIRYVGDASSVQSTLRAMDAAHATLASKLKSVGASISRVGSTITKGVTLPLVGLAAVGVREFSEFQQVTAQTEAAIKSTGGAAGVTAEHVQRLSDRMQGLAAVESDQVQTAANVLLTFTKIRNEGEGLNAVFDRATKATLDLSARMGTDLTSASTMVGKALNDPIKGLTSLTRVGVAFTEEQRKQIEAMVKAGNVAGAQKVILAELAVEFGGSAKAAGDSASPMTQLSLAFKDIAQVVGASVVPVLQRLAEWVKGIATAFQNLSPHTQQMIVTAAAIAAAVGPVLIVFGKVVSAIGAISGAFRVLSTLLIANPWVAVATAAVAAVILIVKNWKPIAAFFVKIWNAIKAAALVVWNAIKKAVITVFNAIKAPVVAYVNFYKAAWNVIKDVAVGVWNAIKGAAKTVFEFLKAGWRGIKDVVTGVWDTIWGAIKTVFNAIAGAWNNTVGKLSFRVPDWVPGIGGFGFDVPDIPTLARGGRIIGAGLAVVGERGPELLALPGGVAVAPLGRAPSSQGLAVSLTLDRRRFGRGWEQELLTRQGA